MSSNEPVLNLAMPINRRILLKVLRKLEIGRFRTLTANCTVHELLYEAMNDGLSAHPWHSYIMQLSAFKFAIMTD